MDLPPEIKDRFRRFGRQGGRKRAANLSSDARRAAASRAAAARWIRRRFGAASFEARGLPGGDLVDDGLAGLAEGRTTVESLLVSLAAPRLRKEGVPVVRTEEEPEERLFALLSTRYGELAHARYTALLRQISSFADACRTARARGGDDAK